ncbi:peptidoglycan binding domain-containing protein [Calothrix sp. NIES-2100]|nr:peptidoglycan binding domain-containing protein [Calothrix sp. NIES-2100]
MLCVFQSRTPRFLRIEPARSISAVKDIQAFLKQQGYYTGAVDGIYGSATAASVEAFQQHYANLQNDGIVGRNTWSTIEWH